MDCNDFSDFWEKDPIMADTLLDRILEPFYGREKWGSDVNASVEKFDSLNYRLTGTIKALDGRMFNFSICDGDRNGTVIEEWSEISNAG